MREQVAGGQEIGKFADSGAQRRSEPLGASLDLRARLTDERQIVVESLGQLADGLVVSGEIDPGARRRS